MKTFKPLMAIGMGALVLSATTYSAGFFSGKRTHQADSELVEEFLKKKDRWAIKTGVDVGASAIGVSDASMAAAQTATVASLVELKKSKVKKVAGVKPGSVRNDPIENTLYRIDADMVGYKLEKDDQDLHIVIRDHNAAASAPTMVIEIPDPTVVSKKSPWRSRIAIVRSKFYASFKPASKIKKCKVHIKVVGVGFFDKIHGQTGVAENGIELHPVLSFDLL